MPLPTRANRSPWAVLALLLLAVPVLSGCLRYTQSLTIHPDDTVSGIIIIAGREPDPVSAPQAPAVPEGAALVEPKSDSENIVVTAFAHAQETGYKVTFTGATFEEVAAFAPFGPDGGALLITRYGDQLEILMTVDLTYSLPAQGQTYIAEHAELSVSLQVPGEVTETNGEVSGDRVTWNLTPFTVNTVSATVSSPLEASTQPEATRSIDPLRAALLLAGALILLAGGWLLLRRYLSRPPSERAHGAPSGRRSTAQPVHEQRRGHQARPGSRPGVADRPNRRAVRGAGPTPPDPFGGPDPVVRSAETASRVRPVQDIDGGGWPPPRPLWKEHR